MKKSGKKMRLVLQLYAFSIVCLTCSCRTQTQSLPFPEESPGGFSKEQYNLILRCSKIRNMNEWNQWRKDNHNEDILLGNADLSNTYLENANLDYAHLECAILTNAYLEKIDLNHAHLERAKLSDANLKNGSLMGAYLDETDLSKANLQNAWLHSSRLRGAILKGSNLKKATLEEADLTGADVDNTDFEEANLFNAILKDLKNPNWNDIKKKAFYCDRKQYNMLIECSEKQNLTKWNNWRKNNKGKVIYLKKAKLDEAHLEEADLRGVHLEQAKLNSAKLKGAKLNAAHLEQAELNNAILEKVEFTRTHLEKAKLNNADLKSAKLILTYLTGADCKMAIVDGLTILESCTIDNYPYTDFRGVGLDSARIDHRTKNLLEYQIRRLNWKEWYNSHPWLHYPAHCFWWISDYGGSPSRILAIFCSLVFIFAIIYYLVPDLIEELHKEEHLYTAFIRAIYFSVVTMTTLGLGDVKVNYKSCLGHILVMLQVLFGYIILGTLITCLAILYTTKGP